MSIIAVPTKSGVAAVPAPPFGVQGAKGDPGSPGGGYASRSAMAARAAPALLDDVYLTEAGREGKFVVGAASAWTSLIAADTQQGIFVASTADGTKVYIRIEAFARLEFNVKHFGAKCDASADGLSGTDDVAKVQATIAFASAAGGGTVIVAAHTKCASSLDIASKRNIRLAGATGPAAGYGIFPPTQLIYTGTGARFVDLRSSLSCEVINLGVRYTSALFTGDVIDFSHDGSAADSTYARVSGCLIGGIGVYSARRCINLLDAIRATIKENHISCAAVGIGGKLESSPGYSNAHSIKDNTFDNLTTAAILNAGEGWTIIGNGFEGTNDGVSGGMPRAFYDDFSAPAGNIINGLTWIGNWCGDDVAVTDAWFSNNNSAIRGLCIQGGAFFNTGTGKSIKLPSTVSGGSIAGLTCKEIDLGSVAHYGLDIRGNFYTNEISNLSNGALDVHIEANKVNGGFAKTYIRVANPQEMALGDPFGATSVFATVTGLNEVDVHGVKVVGVRQTGTAANATDLATALTLVNDLKTKLIAHGSIS